MGWTSSAEWQTKKQLVSYLVNPDYWGKYYAVLKHSEQDNNLWVLVEHTNEAGTKKVFIALYLLSHFGGGEGYGYKDMDETCGPNELNCPKQFILEAEKSGPGHNQWARDWREKVLKYHAAKAKKGKAVAALKAGDDVELYGEQYTLTSPAGPRLGWHETRIKDGQPFRMNAQQVRQATLMQNG